MPELPEVEILRRELSLIKGAKIIRVKTDGSIRFKQAAFASGGQIGSILRRGKWLSLPIINFQGVTKGHVGIHLGMTGQLLLVPPAQHPKSLRVSFELSDSQALELGDLRGFGRVTFTNNPFEGLILGPEPGENNFLPTLSRISRNSSAPIFVKLLDQKNIAGVGAYIAQEALWRACISPHSRSINDKKITLLAKKLNDVIKDSLSSGGMTMSNYSHLDGSSGQAFALLDCYKRAGQPCPRCGERFQKDRINGRGVTWCISCQS